MSGCGVVWMSGSGVVLKLGAPEVTTAEGGNAPAGSPGTGVIVFNGEFARGVQVGRGVGDAISASQATSMSAAPMQIVMTPR